MTTPSARLRRTAPYRPAGTARTTARSIAPVASHAVTASFEPMIETIGVLESADVPRRPVRSPPSHSA